MKTGSCLSRSPTCARSVNSRPIAEASSTGRRRRLAAGQGNVHRPLGAILVLWVLLACPAGDSVASTVADGGPDEVIAAAIEATQSGGKALIDGEPLASVVVLPELYERRGFRPAWTSLAAADALVRAIRQSADDGLDPADYHLAAIERLRATTPATQETQGRLDLLLTDAAVRLAYHLRFGKVDPEALDADWNLESDLGGVDPVTVLQQAIDEGRVYEALEDLKPRYPFYTRLRGALAEYRRIAAAGGWDTIPAGGPLKPGVNDGRVTLLRRRLGVTGDLPDTAASDPSSQYDAAVEAGVKAFQERHGLPPDGAVGAATLRALDVPVAVRIDQIRATLERCRWVMHDLPERFVLVNVAGFTVTVMGPDGPTWDSRVVVGKPYTKTPIFRADMRYVVLNPTWTVPPGIMRKEVIPGMRRDPHYLERTGYVMADGQVVQPAGPKNALGRVKLIFPNPHHVYLHDTPQKSYFNETSRSFSHGCVRVQKPFELAALALDDPAWTIQTLLDAAANGKTRTIVLQKPLPVLILYWTAEVDRNERVRFLADIYQRDPAVIRALAARFSFRKRPVIGATGRTTRREDRLEKEND
jgi:murein L,D-transpeptidase YcbB/YkuD